MKNNKLFANYEISSIAKEKGFDDICFALVDEKNRIHLLNISDSDNLKFNQLTGKYNGEKCVPSPLLAQLLDWFREKYNINPTSKICSDSRYMSDVSKNDSNDSYILGVQAQYHKTYYEALNKAIEEALKLI